jgi:hypothetical protein
MKADLEPAVAVALINLVVGLDPNLAFRIMGAGMDDGPGAALTTATAVILIGDRRNGAVCRAIFLLLSNSGKSAYLDFYPALSVTDPPAPTQVNE